MGSATVGVGIRPTMAASTAPHRFINAEHAREPTRFRRIAVAQANNGTDNDRS